MSGTALARVPHGVDSGRATTVALLIDEVGYATRELWRSRMVLVFTFVLPLAWLLIIGTIAGNQVDAASGASVMQFVTPTAALMAIMFAAFPPVARSLGEARERRLLKRIEGTPLPVWMYLVGRIGGAVMLSLTSIIVMFAVGFLFYDVKIVWESLPATLLTIGVAIAMFASLGLAVGSIAPSANSAQTVAVAGAILVSFLSGLFTMGMTNADWVTTLGSYFPAVHVLNPLRDQFSPALVGPRWEFNEMALVALWALCGIVVAIWALRRETIYGSSRQSRRLSSWRVGRTRAQAVDASAEPDVVATSVRSLNVETVRRPSDAALVADQTSWTLRAASRDVSWIAFALGMPVALYVFMTAQLNTPDALVSGMPFALYFACAMTAYGIGVTAFVNVPVDVARLRDQLVLKRVRGTPLPPAQLLAGRTVATLLLALITAAIIYATAVVFFGAIVPLVGLFPAALIVLLGAATLAACGYALACLVKTARSLAVVSLAILLPLAFFSDIFVVGSVVPDWFATVGNLFPLRHFAHALAGSLSPAGIAIDLGDILVLVVWLVLASTFAVRHWRWQPNS